MEIPILHGWWTSSYWDGTLILILRLIESFLAKLHAGCARVWFLCALICTCLLQMVSGADSYSGPPLDLASGPPFVCPVCSKEFRHPGGLVKHNNEVHLRLNRHACPACGVTFSQPGNLQRHVLRRHGGNKRFHCPSCPLAYAWKADLMDHMRRAGHGGYGGGDSNNPTSEGGGDQMQQWRGWSTNQCACFVIISMA